MRAGQLAWSLAIAMGLGACAGKNPAGEEKVRLGQGGQVTQTGAQAGKANLKGSVLAPRTGLAWRLQAVRTEAGANAKLVAYDDGGLKVGEATASSSGAFTLTNLPINEPLRVVATLPAGQLVAVGRAYDGAPDLVVGPGSTAVVAWLLQRTQGKLLNFEQAGMGAAVADVEGQVEAEAFRSAWASQADLAALVAARRLGNPLLASLMAGLDGQLAREGFGEKQVQGDAAASAAQGEGAASGAQADAKASGT